MSPRKHRILLLAVVVLAAIAWSAPSQAQARRGGRGHSVVVVGGGYYGGYYPGYFYDPFWFGFGYPYYPYAMGPYPYGYYRGDPGSAIRLDAKPDRKSVV